jgi:hypothetical protein
MSDDDYSDFPYSGVDDGSGDGDRSDAAAGSESSDWWWTEHLPELVWTGLWMILFLVSLISNLVRVSALPGSNPRPQFNHL